MEKSEKCITESLGYDIMFDAALDSIHPNWEVLKTGEEEE